MPISWNMVIFKFRSIFATDERRIMSGMAFHSMFWGIPLNRVSFVETDQWASPKHHMKGHARHNSSLIGRKNQAKFENDCVLRNGHRIKITQPNSMILVSISSADVALFDDTKRHDTFRLQGTENPPFPLFMGHPVYQVSTVLALLYTYQSPSTMR